MHDTNCPYCDEGVEINHDDGYGYGEDDKFEQECHSCKKTFVFTTSMSFYYDTSKASCLNGGKHKEKPTATFPSCFAKMLCEMCGNERVPTDEERAKHDLMTFKEYEEQVRIERLQKSAI